MKIADKILVVEDDTGILRFIRSALEGQGYDVVSAVTGEEALAIAASHCPDLMLLDLGLPDMNGVKIIEDIRSWSRMPIVVVSARSHENDKIEAFELGADDYVTKPFSTGELLARVGVALRHARGTTRTADRYSAKGLTIDYDSHIVTLSGERVHLTQNEYRILSLLSQYAGKVLTYDFLLKELWGPIAPGNNQILRVNMANIRRKIEKNPAEPEYVFTEVGVGYRMIEEE